MAFALYQIDFILYFRDMRKRSVFNFQFYFLLMLFFLGISAVLNNKLCRSDEKVAKDFQEKVLQFSVEIKTALIELNETFREKGFLEFQEKALAYPSENGENLAFFLYQNNKLIFWSNNQILLSSSDSLLNLDLAVEKIGPHWLLKEHISGTDYIILGVKILQADYLIKNEFLKDHFLEDYGINAAIKLSKKQNQYEITDSDGNFIFSIDFRSNGQSGKMPYLLFFTFLISYVFYVLTVDGALKYFNVYSTSPKLRLLLFSIFNGLFLLFFVLMHFPEALFQSPLFQPQLYSNPSIYSSLGYLFLFSLWIFSTVVYFNYNVIINPIKNKSTSTQIVWASTVIILLTLIYYFLYSLIISLVFDSQISFEITFITKLDFYSYTVLLLVMLLQLSWFLISKKFINQILTGLKNKLYFVIIIFLAALLFAYLPNQKYPLNQYNQLFLFIYYISLFYLFNRNFKNAFWQNVYFLILFISISGLYYITFVHHKEENTRKIGLSTYLLKNDPVFENHFLSETTLIQNDSLILESIKQPNFSSSAVLAHIMNNYFLEASKNYEISMVFCTANSQLLLMPQEIETPCFSFFDERIKESIDTIRENSLYLVDQHFRSRNYIGIIAFNAANNEKTKLFVEFLSKYQPKELGIPALLSDTKNWDLNFFSNYAYAYYYQGELNEWFGHFDYKQSLESYKQNLTEKENYFVFDNYFHYLYLQDDQNVLIVSKPNLSWLKKLGSFAFLFLFYSLNILGIFGFIYMSQNFNKLDTGFQSRLQLNMIGILLFSFFTIGFASLYYLYYLNNEKNKSTLMEKGHSVLIELEHKLKNLNEPSDIQSDYLETLLVKFSQVFFSDINLFDLNGKLLASSRPKLYDSELLSRRMNPIAYYNLNVLKSSVFMHNEQIGLQKFYSVYLPFRSEKNQTVAYLSLPYFAKQYELEEEISGFLVAYLNIYLFLILLTLALTILISNYLSKPIKLLREKIQKVRLEVTNEKIEWNKEDEIGLLIFEYNRMVDELSESAEKLARSQRESAWREMAQQIAHEIKNPLTPMKLNIQYLEKAWKEGGEDFDKKLGRISKNITEQIDSLSDIASQFSSFAAIDQIKLETIPLKNLLLSSIDLFSHLNHIDFKTNLPENELYIQADRNQFIRILNNLLKNAVQSIAEKASGEIVIKLESINEHAEIQIIDNGCGISQNEKPYIFEPRFTTKTGGMGLGLSLVKKMAENANGTISFESEENKGTKFVLNFPLIKK